MQWGDTFSVCNIQRTMLGIPHDKCHGSEIELVLSLHTVTYTIVYFYRRGEPTVISHVLWVENIAPLSWGNLHVFIS